MSGYCAECGNTLCVCDVPGVVGDAGTPEPASLRDQICALLIRECAAEDDQWRSSKFFPMVADKVLAVPGVAAALRTQALVDECLAALDEHPFGLDLINAAARSNELTQTLLAALRAVGKDTDQP